MQTSPTGAIRGYDLRQVLGAGGFGVVYRAFQTAVDREVAVKVILPEYANRPEFIRRFEIEAQLVARLEHLHIVPLYDYWREPDGAYLVMRYLRGGSLRDALRHGPLDARDADRLIDQVSQALTIAHRQRVVHRDIKPENILLDEERNFYLSDFGIAKDLLHDSDATRSGLITGSPGYISPEQALGQELTPRSDLYSLGVVMWEVLAGRHPFQGAAPAAQIARHLTEPLPSLRTEQPGLPEALDDVIQTVTAKPPEQRYADVRSFAIAFRDALSGRSAQITVPATTPAAFVELVNPYKGLRAFESADAADFFGRETLTGRLLGRLREDVEAGRFLAVVGPSGSGKSSVVKAGLLPALRKGALPGSERWFVVEMVPGGHPLDELEIGLLRVAVGRPSGLMEQLRRDERGLLRAARLAVPADDGEVLLVIDQFEELFTGADRGEAEQLLRVVQAAALDPRSRVRVIITLRADFYDRPLMHPDFSRLMQRRTEVVLPLNAEELADAICKPAEHAGAELEPGLAEAIVADVREQPGALPMLQYALTELFERREGRRLTKAAYEATGRVSGALARRAEDVFVHLDDVQQAAARQLFLRLVTLGEGTEDTRRRTLHGELKALDVDQRALDVVLHAFGKSRLLLFDRDPATREPTVEVAHEALLREWRRLRGWLDESRADVRMQRLLGAAAREWAQAPRDASFLLRGTRLAQFEGWAAASKVALAHDEREFLEASSAERRAEEAAEAARHQRELAAAQQLAESERRRAVVQAESARRVKRAALGLAALALVAVVLAGVAFQARSAAQAERDHAQRTAAVNHSLLLAADAQRVMSTGDVDLALQLGLQAARLDEPPAEAIQALMAVALGPGTRAVLKGHTAAVRAVAFSPDGRYAASGSCAEADATTTCGAGETIIWDVGSKAEVRRFKLHRGWINAVAFTPDGKYLLSGSADGTLLLSAVDTGEPKHRFEGHRGGVNAVALSPDGHAALSGSDDGTVILWNIDSGAAVRRFTGHRGGVTSLALAPPCRPAVPCRLTVLSGSEDKTVILWDVATGAPLRTIIGHDNKVTGVAYLPDGRRALSVSLDLTLRQWDLTTGAEVHRQLFIATPHCLALSGDGHIAVKQLGSGVELWDVEDWRLVQLLQGHGGLRVNALAVSPDQRFVLSAGEDKTLRLWNVKGQREMRRLRSPEPFAAVVRASPDARHLLTGGVGGGTLWNLEAGSPVRQLPMPYQLSPGSAAFSPDGHRVLIATSGVLRGQRDKGALHLFDVATGQLVHSLSGHRIPVRSVAFGPDGRLALSGSQSGLPLTGELILWDVAAGREIRRFDTAMDITSIAFSADGRRAVTGSAGQPGATYWDVETGRELRRYDNGKMPVLAVAFGPGDRTAFHASIDGTLIEWDTSTGAVVRRFTGHRSPVFALDVSKDRRFLLSAAQDGSVIEWDLTTGSEVNRFVGHPGSVFSVGFHPDGRSAFSASADGTVIQWRLGEWTAAQLAGWAKENRFQRDLTCEERAQYRVEPPCGAR